MMDKLTLPTEPIAFSQLLIANVILLENSPFDQSNNLLRENTNCLTGQQPSQIK